MSSAFDAPRTAPPVGPARLAWFVRRFGGLLARDPDEAAIVAEGGQLLGVLVAADDWLAPAFAAADSQRYRQYLLHCDSLERFSVVAFVWGPGQQTPIHNHTVWGLVGVLRGAEISQAYRRRGGELQADGAAQRLDPGQVTAVSPTLGDLHRVANAYPDRTSISIHVYGGNIGRIRRSAYDDAGRAKTFVSGYSNDVLPNPWGL